MPQTQVASSVATPADTEASRARRPADITGSLLTIVEHRVGRRAVLSVAGEVDISTAAALRAAIDTAAGGASEIWVDLSETTFFDSSGLHAMVGVRAELADANRRLVLICPDGPVLRVLELTGLDRLFEIHANRSDANHAAA